MRFFPFITRLSSCKDYVLLHNRDLLLDTHFRHQAKDPRSDLVVADRIAVGGVKALREPRTANDFVPHLH